MEPDHGATSRAWSWRHAVGKSGLPPITRLVLHTLGLKMDATGGSCYPPISELVELTGLDKKTVLKHLEIAEGAGWIEVGQHGFRGQKWKRNEYVARWPGRDLTGEPGPCDGHEGGGGVPPRSNTCRTLEGGGAAPPPCGEKVVELVREGGGNDDLKVVEELHQDKILPTNIPNNSPTAGPNAGPTAVAEEGALRRADRKRSEHAFTLWFATWRKGDVDFARNAWFALSPEERGECIEHTPAYLRFAKPSDLMAAAVYLKNRHWRDLPEHLLGVPEKTHGVAKPCGKLWMGTRLETLSKDPTGPIHITAFDETRIAKGMISRDQLMHDKRRDNGWPLVNAMRDLARRREPFTTSLGILPEVADFRPVHRDSAVFAAWKALHEARGWPFIEYAPEWVYFPAVDAEAEDLTAAVEAALASFLSAIREGRTDDPV
jgi:hypothetical protein